MRGCIGRGQGVCMEDRNVNREVGRKRTCVWRDREVKGGCMEIGKN